MAIRMRGSRLIAPVLTLGLGVAAVSCGGGEKAGDRVRLNELQFIGTHNSYHVRPPAALVDAIAAVDPLSARIFEFGHPPLQQQLDGGVRLLELDVYADPEGGRFANPVAPRLLGIAAPEGRAELVAQGFKVLHFPELDFYSTCWTLKSCLGQIATWSAQHPDHLPVMVWIEPKDEAIPDPLNLGFVQPLPIDAAALRALETEVLSAFDRDRLITPDMVRRGRPTLEEVVLKDGWPALDALRGKVMLVLMGDAAKREAYRDGAASLEGRALFTISSPGQPDAAVIKVDEPRGMEDRIQQWVRAGYLVRTLADIDTWEARANDASRRDAALTSGANYVGTDYTQSTGVAAGGYAVRFPDGSLMRCNPVTASARCAAAIAERAR